MTLTLPDKLPEDFPFPNFEEEKIAEDLANDPDFNGMMAEHKDYVCFFFDKEQDQIGIEFNHENAEAIGSIIGLILGDMTKEMLIDGVEQHLLTHGTEEDTEVVKDKIVFWLRKRYEHEEELREISQGPKNDDPVVSPFQYARNRGQ